MDALAWNVTLFLALIVVTGVAAAGWLRGRR